MIKLLYSNTADGVLLPTGGDNSDRTVLVKSELDGHKLIATWNATANSQHSQFPHTPHYVYAVVEMTPATKEDIETLDLY